MLGGCGNKQIDDGSVLVDTPAATEPYKTNQYLPPPSGAVVLSIGTETVTTDEIIALAATKLATITPGRDFNGFSMQAKPMIAEAVQTKTVDLLLYKQARKNAPADIDTLLEKHVESEINKFIASFGGNYARAQEAIEQQGLDWDGFRDYQKRMVLVQSYISQELADNAPVTHSEMLAFYDVFKEKRFQIKGKMSFRVIDIQPEILDETDKDAATEKALELAKGLMIRINNGEDFASLAKEFSHGHRAENGGLWNDVTSGSLAGPYSALEIEAAKLKPGQTATPITADGHVFIVKLESNIEEVNRLFQDVQYEIEADIRFSRKMKLYNEMVSKLILKANIANSDDFVEYCVEAAYRNYVFGG
jgi:parvulin-like peptidyl-prolyl isomerase